MNTSILQLIKIIPINDPVQTISAASNKLIGKVYVDDETEKHQ